MDDRLSVPLLNIYLHHTAGMVVFDGILHQVGKHTAKQHIAADNSNILPFTREGNPVALGQRGEVGKDLVDHGREQNDIVARNGLKIAHVQQRMRKPTELLDFVLQGGEERRAFRRNIRMPIGEKLQLCLQQRQRRAQFMGGVADELPLSVKAAAQALQHFIEGVGEGAKLRQGLFVEPDLGKVACLHLFGLLRKTAQRTQRMTADEITSSDGIAAEML